MFWKFCRCEILCLHYAIVKNNLWKFGKKLHVLMATFPIKQFF